MIGDGLSHIPLRVRPAVLFADPVFAGLVGGQSSQRLVGSSIKQRTSDRQADGT